MKIVMVTPYLPPRLGGREFWVDWMSRELAANGVEVTVIAANVLDYHKHRCRWDMSIHDGVRFFRVPVLYDIDKYTTPIVIPPLVLLRRENPDIIHIHEPNIFLTTPLALYAKYCLGKRVIMHCYSDPFDWYKSGFWVRSVMFLYAFIHRLKLRISDRIIVISDAYLNGSRYLPAFRFKTDILPMCLAPVFHSLPRHEIEQFKHDQKIGSGQQVVLYVGRLDHRKGIHCLIQAMKRVDAVCLIVGNGEQDTEAYLRRLAVDGGLEDRVRFVGRQDQATLNRFYNACDVLVLPTSDESAETFGAVLLEAWAAGKPVISADNPAPRRLIEAASGGLVVPREDARALADTIYRVLGDSNLAREMGRNGFQFAQRFSFKNTAVELIKIYRGLLSR